MKSILAKLSALLLILTVGLSLLAGCVTHQPVSTTQAAGSTESAPSTEPQPAEPAEITVFLRERWAGVPFDGQILQGIQEKTNTKWHIIAGTATDLDAQLNTLFAARNYPDILSFGGEEAFLVDMIDDGILLPLDEYLDKLPNLYETKKTVWNNLKYKKDGKVYHVSAGTEPNGGVDVLMSYRKDWLDKFGFSVPETMEEYIEVADAFSNRDPDGNNVKDTFAIGARAGSLGRFGDFIFAAHGVLPDFWITEEKGSDKVVYGSVHPNMREALRVAAHLFKIGAIDPEFITDDNSTYNAKLTGGKYGACAIFRTNYDPNNATLYKPFKEKNPNGEWVFADIPRAATYRDDISLRALSPRGWLRTGIYAKSKEVDACLRVLDWMNTDEGIMYNQYGVSGEHYELKDGVVTKLVDEQKSRELGISLVYLASEFLSLDWTPELQAATAFCKSHATFNAVDGIITEESNLYEKDLEEYVDSQIIRIIFGEIPVDEGFDEMVSEFYRRGGQELTDAYNRAKGAK